MVYSEYVKLRILYLRGLGYHPTPITRILEGEGIKAITASGVAKFLKQYRETGKGQFYALLEQLHNFPTGRLMKEFVLTRL